VKREGTEAEDGEEEKKEPPACRGEGSAAGPQLHVESHVRFVHAAMLAMPRATALGTLALQCVSKARDWTGHVAR
jgi:hypothetical protein